MGILKESIREADYNLTVLTTKYESEQYDVEKLKKDSLSTLMIKLFGKYEDKFEKESKEMLDAKLKLDEASTRLLELEDEYETVNNRLIELRRSKITYDLELKKREETAKNTLLEEGSKEYKEVLEKIDTCRKEKIEIEEALTAARRAYSVAESAKIHLEKAESHATYDVWFKGGIINHMLKYGNIDEAENYINRLSSCLKELEKELSDININNSPQIEGISGSQRAVDLWFDNIFTDLNVRDKIRGNIHEINSTMSTIHKITRKLEERKIDVLRRISAFEGEKEKLLLSIE